jgi:hypothetical protein
MLSVKLGNDCVQLPLPAVSARQTRSFVYALITVFVSSIETRRPRSAVDRRCSSDARPSQLKEHSTLKSLCRGTKNRPRFGSTRAKFARGSVRSAALGNVVSTLRGKATNIAARIRYRALDALQRSSGRISRNVTRWKVGRSSS